MRIHPEPAIEEIVTECKKGKTFEFFTKQDPATNDYPDLTDSFSVGKLEFSNSELTRGVDGIYNNSLNTRIYHTLLLIDSICTQRILLSCFSS